MRTYELIIDDEINDDELGMTYISIVDTPAIKVKGYAFSDQKEYKFSFDKDKQIIAGPALIPDIKIKRLDEFGMEYYVFFTKETIEKMVKKFMKNGTLNKINFNHQDKIVDAYILSSWIIEDEDKDKSRLYGYDLPVGSFFVEVKVEDEGFWNNYVKNGFNSFSIEGYFNEKIMKFAEINRQSKARPVPKSLIDRIAFAIENRAFISFDYDNRWSKYEAIRNVRPLALGKLASSGRLALRAYIENNNSYAIINGTSTSRFRIFLLSRFSGVSFLGQDLFSIPAGYRRNDRDLTGIIAQLSLSEDQYDEDIKDDEFVEVNYELKDDDIIDIVLEDIVEEEFGETYDDYPKAATENAQRALDYAEKNGWGSCGTPVGKTRANQLAKGEKISRETIARMSAFARHLQYDDKELGDGCGKLMILSWGGREGIEWANRKLKEIDNKE